MTDDRCPVVVNGVRCVQPDGHQQDSPCYYRDGAGKLRRLTELAEETQAAEPGQTNTDADLDATFGPEPA